MRPSLGEATEQLEELITPALESGLGALTPAPRPSTDPHSCDNPFLGPRGGVMPVIEYELAFDDSVEKAWRDQGLSVDEEDEEESRTRRVSRDGYMHQP